MQRRRRNRIQISRDIICLFLLFIFVLLYYKSHFRQTCHLYSGEMSKRHLVEDSDRSNNIFTAILSEISTWMLKEMFQSINQSIFIRPKTYLKRHILSYISCQESKNTWHTVYIYIYIYIYIYKWRNQKGRIDSLFLWVSRLSARQTELYSIKNMPPYIQIRWVAN